jgi:hypothetical protein
VLLDSGEILVYDLRLEVYVLDLVDGFFLIESGSTLPVVELDCRGVVSNVPVATNGWRLLRGNGDGASSSVKDESS